jgi:hypothetical protein
VNFLTHLLFDHRGVIFKKKCSMQANKTTEGTHNGIPGISIQVLLSSSRTVMLSNISLYNYFTIYIGGLESISFELRVSCLSVMIGKPIECNSQTKVSR